MENVSNGRVSEPFHAMIEIGDYRSIIPSLKSLGHQRLTCSPEMKHMGEI